MLVMPQTLNQH